MKKTNSKRFTKIATIIISSIVLVFCSAKIVIATQSDSITASNTTGNIIVEDNQFNGTTISPTLVFTSTGDSITYNIPFSSPDGTTYKISNVTDDNTDPYITTSYSYDDSNNAEEKSILATMTYTNPLPKNMALSLNDIHISVTIEEENSTVEPDDPTPVEPDDPTPVEPDDPTPVEPDDPTPVEPDDPTLVEPDDPTAKIITPNTGKYFQGQASSQPDNILPYLILGCLSIISLIFTILPKKSRIKFGAPILLLTFTLGNVLFLRNSYADTKNYNFTILGANVSVIPPQDAVSFYFPNIYNNPDLLDDVDLDDSSTFGNGNTIIMKTLDNKYVLLDTGAAIKNTKSIIYNKLKELQNKNQVTLDYLIISHLDGDHYGNAVSLLNDNNITIHNLIVKHEQYNDASMNNTRGNAFTKIVKAAADNNVKIMTSASAESIIENETTATSFSKISEGMVISVGEYLKLNFFNTKNVYDGKECKSGTRIYWKSTVNPNLPYKTSDGKYVYFDGSEYPNITLKTTTTFLRKEGGSGINRYFYAIDKNNDLTALEDGNICKSNPNSFGILAEVAVYKDTKYAYFPNDMENAGYDNRQSGGNSSRIFKNLTFDESTGDFKTDITPYTIPSEINTANWIYSKLSNDATERGVTTNHLLDNINIYQMSHHGRNNNEEAINKLNLNRSNGIYAIQEDYSLLENHNNWTATKTYNYTLKNIPADKKMRVGTNDKSGVKCTINTINATTCTFY